MFCQKLTDGTNEVNISDLGSSGAPNWKTNKDYKANSLVYINDKLYICIEEHTSSADFATDLLSGKWKFIGNGVGSNVVQTVLYEGEVHITAANTDLNPISHTMSDDMTNYDYIIITFHNSGVGRLTVVAKPIVGDYYTERWSTDLIGADGKTYNASYMIRLFDSRTIYVGLYRPSVTLTGWTYIYVESVVGIKIQELTTDYLASLAMPSDVYETISVTPEVYKTYTPTANGYITLVGSAGGVGAYVTVFSNTVKQTAFSSAQLQQIRVTCAVKKGTDYEIRAANLTSLEAIFVYTVGDAKQLGLMD